ncbi:hypothetical protein BDK51DRAFT_39263 [Blyttiomyces helicus]|uniref:Uncharacterized protein n=1 Tax=Blyttiomyces helicus TaxID=388810 RepID=A0A4P9VV89_9FUNG|nr:hypothetical protein BDK51DRAFT_39263 [Blyttiomyces helicus]|eukprot:RKO83551.1 hypothetical protein BDK51DRAFT_39263 [Blyttiomyces helicus]
MDLVERVARAKEESTRRGLIFNTEINRTLFQKNGCIISLNHATLHQPVFNTTPEFREHPDEALASALDQLDSYFSNSGPSTACAPTLPSTKQVVYPSIKGFVDLMDLNPHVSYMDLVLDAIAPSVVPAVYPKASLEAVPVALNPAAGLLSMMTAEENADGHAPANYCGRESREASSLPGGRSPVTANAAETFSPRPTAPIGVRLAPQRESALGDGRIASHLRLPPGKQGLTNSLVRPSDGSDMEEIDPEAEGSDDEGYY